MHSAVNALNQKVSVFIPVFNGEQYLAETLDSVLAQTLQDFEVICVDDGSNDASLAILRAYAAKDPRVKVLQTPANMGSVSKVLNFALPSMQGAYFVYSSQDDIFSADWLEKMHAKATSTGADAVIPDVVFYHAGDASKNRTLSGLGGDRTVELSNREAVRHSLDWAIPANALWNANLIKKFQFEEFGMNADEYSARIFFLNCNKVVFSEGTFFYRQDNGNAVTKKTNYKTFDYPYTQFRLYQLLRDQQFSTEDVQSAALKVVDIMRRLRLWLDTNPNALSAEDTQKAETRLGKCMEQLKTDPMFAQVIGSM